MLVLRLHPPRWWALCAVVACAAPTARGQWHYHYFDEQRPLTADPGRIAVLSADGVAAAPAKLPGFTVDSWYAPGWALASFQGGIAAADLEQVVADAASAVAFASPVFLDKFGQPLIVTPDILVGFRAGVDGLRAERILLASGAGTLARRRVGGMSGVYRLRSGSRNGFEVLEAANALARLPEVLFAEPDMLFTGRGGLVPTDPLFPDAWALENTGQFGGTPGVDLAAVDAWDITIGDASVIVAILDTGIDQTHPDLNQLTPGTDTTSDPSTDGGPVNSFDDHGTVVAGCVSGLINNDLGAVGIAPGCRVTSARTFIAVNSSGQWTSQASWTVNSLAWAEGIGVKITNNSNCYAFESAAIDTKYEQTRADGMIHFASSCNDGEGELAYPSLLPTVNAVGALTSSGERALFSNIGEGLAYSAPGVDIVTTDRTGADGYNATDYAFVQGTSFSSPFAAGVAALFLSRYPTATPDEVELALRETAVDVNVPGYDVVTGWGLVSALEALQWRPECSTPETIQIEVESGSRSRYVSFTPPRTSWPASLRITADALAPPYDTSNGASWWVGPPQLEQGNATPPTEFYLSSLQCTPVYWNWSSIDVLYLYGTQMIPESTYSVVTKLEGCDEPVEYPSYTSEPVSVASSMAWGDVADPLHDDTVAPQPDFKDVAAMVLAFIDAPGSPSLLHADLNPAFPDLLIDFHDINRCVEAFRGQPYSLEPPELCP